MGPTELSAGRNEHSKLYRQLQLKEPELRLLFDSDIIGVVFWDPDGAIREANDSFLRMVGYERADLTSGGLHWTELTPPEWIGRDRHVQPQVDRTGSLQPYEQEFSRKDGSRVRVLLERRGLDEDGKDGFALVVDITARRSAEQELRRGQEHPTEAQKERWEHRLEARLQATLNMIPAFTWYAAPDGAITFANERCANYSGLPSDHPHRFGIRTSEAWDSHIQHLHPDDHDETRKVWSTCLATGSAGEVSFRVRSAQGIYRWFLSRVEPLRAEDGTLLYWIGINLDIEERKKAELYLAEAQRLSHTGSWAWNPVSNAILYWSEECYRIFGYDPAQGLPPFESSFRRIHPEDRLALTEAIERAVREKAKFQIDYRLVLPDGTRRNVHIQSHPVLDASGELVEFVGTVVDLTEQKRAEDERREHLWFLESMDRINRAMQRSNDVELMTSAVMQEALEIFACDRIVLVYPCDPEAPAYQTVMERASPHYTGALTLGIDLPATPEGAELNRRCLGESGVVVDPKLPAELHERFRIASMLTIAVRPKGDQPYRFTVQCMRTRPWTGVELRLFEEIARRMEDALTSVLAYRNLLARDVELRRSRAYLAEAQKVSHTGSWAWNNETREIAYWSDECFRIHGRDPAKGLPSLVQMLADIHPDDARDIEASLERLHEDREVEGQYRMVNIADGPRIIRSIAHPVLDHSGRVIEYIGTVVDITEQKRAERDLSTSELERARVQQALREAREKLAQASKIASLAELSASIAHEINQPLQAIVANGHASLRWLDAKPPNIEKAIRTAQRVVRDGNDAAEVVGRIRALFKHAAPAKVDLDVNLLIVQVPTLMAEEVQGSGLCLEIELDEDLPKIRADAVQIQQVIVNLVRNAIEAMVETRRNPLLIRSRRSAGHVVIDVRDQGTGLANLEKIFEPFVTTKQTGMGMGLAICRSIIEAHAGEIGVVHNEGPGVTFSFSLPINASDAT